MTTKNEALRLALEALRQDRAWLESDAPEDIWTLNNDALAAVIYAYHEALAQPAGERGELLKLVQDVRRTGVDNPDTQDALDVLETALLSADAQPPEWVGLTEDEANALWESTDSDWELMKRTEKFLREKNARKDMPAAADKAGGDEPVATGTWEHLKLMMEESAWDGKIELADALANIVDFEKYYTRPAKEESREWVGLDEGEVEYPHPPAKPPVYATAANTKAVRDGFVLGGYEKEPGYYSEEQLDAFALSIEAKLREKNARKDMPAAEDKAGWDEPVAYIQRDHLQKAMASPFLCRVEPTQRLPDFVPLYTRPQPQADVPETNFGNMKGEEP